MNGKRSGIPVALTRYPGGGRGEVTVWTEMPQVPAVGDSLSFGDPDIPTLCVRRVSWVAEPRRDGGEPTWHAEIDLGVHRYLGGGR